MSSYVVFKFLEYRRQHSGTEEVTLNYSTKLVF